MIDSGLLFADMSFWEQGLNQGTTSDDAFIQLDFYDSSNTLISDADTPTIDSHTGSWTNYTNDYSIPVGTRSITYNMVFVLNQGENIIYRGDLGSSHKRGEPGIEKVSTRRT